MKNCPKCGAQKPLSEFHKNKSSKDKLSRTCAKCATEQSKIWYKKNPDVKRNANLLREYGITLAQLESMKIEQNNKCAICSKTFKNSVDTCVDHCHTTKKVRGLLCNHCNRAIGLFKESASSIESALLYLKKYNQKTEENQS